jgi:hypothetical protein
MLIEAALLPRKLLNEEIRYGTQFYAVSVRTFVVHIITVSVPVPVLFPVPVPIPIPLRQKVLVPVSQHC